MLLHEVNLWYIYLARNCVHTSDLTDKHVVVVCKDGPHAMGFLINTRIHPYIVKRPHLMVCQAEIKREGHERALKYNSWIGCDQLYAFYPNELHVKEGAISVEGKEVILNTVSNCMTIKEKYKKMILNDRVT